MVTKKELESLVNTVEILGNPDTMKQIAGSVADILWLKWYISFDNAYKQVYNLNNEESGTLDIPTNCEVNCY
jgi:hypothetical protein